MVEEIGPEHVVHIVTDNSSNYKKACKELLIEAHSLDNLFSTHRQFDVEGYNSKA